jgi:deoxyuridine 5'-triphosphate nucleotidohydrolase
MAAPEVGCIDVLVAALSPQALLPQKAHLTDAGFDLAVPADSAIAPRAQEVIDLEFALQIPPGWYGQILGRSSVFRRGLMVHPGVIDADYRGGLQLLVVNQWATEQVLKRGDRLAQLLFLPVPEVRLNQVAPDVLSRTARGPGGVGSTGR